MFAQIARTRDVERQLFPIARHKIDVARSLFQIDGPVRLVEWEKNLKAEGLAGMGVKEFLHLGGRLAFAFGSFVSADDGQQVLHNRHVFQKIDVFLFCGPDAGDGQEREFFQFLCAGHVLDRRGEFAGHGVAGGELFFLEQPVHVGVGPEIEGVPFGGTGGAVVFQTGLHELEDLGINSRILAKKIHFKMHGNVFEQGDGIGQQLVVGDDRVGALHHALDSFHVMHGPEQTALVEIHAVPLVQREGHFHGVPDHQDIIGVEFQLAEQLVPQRHQPAHSRVLDRPGPLAEKLHPQDLFQFDGGPLGGVARQPALGELADHVPGMAEFGKEPFVYGVNVNVLEKTMGVVRVCRHDHLAEIHAQQVETACQSGCAAPVHPQHDEHVVYIVSHVFSL